MAQLVPDCCQDSLGASSPSLGGQTLLVDLYVYLCYDLPRKFVGCGLRLDLDGGCLGIQVK